MVLLSGVNVEDVVEPPGGCLLFGSVVPVPVQFIGKIPKDVTAKRMLEALDPKPIEAKTAEPKTEGQPQAEELAKPAPEVDLVGKWQAVAGSTTIDLSITEDSTFSWKATESGKPAVELAGDFGTNGSAVLMETTDKGSLGGTVKSINADEWILNPPGATDDKAGLKFKRVK